MNRIAVLREAKGMSQAELAAAIGVNQSTIHRYENGEYKLKVETALRIISVLDCTLQQLLGDGGI